MKKLHIEGFLTVAALSGFLALGSLPVQAAPAGQSDPQTTQPDNTKVNKRDRSAAQPTADQQKEATNDRELTKKIRRAIVSDKSLSTYAHNVKIIAQNGTVTLKGPVHSEEEKKAVEAKATEIAGPSNVTSQISVKGDARPKS